MHEPEPLHLNKNLCRMDNVPAAQVMRWAVELDEGKKECGTAIAVEAVAFDEGDGKSIRRLAKWLNQAADWLDAQPRKRRRRCVS